MKRRIAFSLLAASLALGLAPAVASAAPTAPAAPVVHIKNFMFVPAKLTVPAGTTVRFVNDDEEPHTVTATDKAFDSEGLDTHQAFTHTFAKAGTFTYFCELYPYMHGTLVVTARKAAS